PIEAHVIDVHLPGLAAPQVLAQDVRRPVGRVEASDRCDEHSPGVVDANVASLQLERPEGLEGADIEAPFERVAQGAAGEHGGGPAGGGQVEVQEGARHDGSGEHEREPDRPEEAPEPTAASRFAPDVGARRPHPGSRGAPRGHQNASPIRTWKVKAVYQGSSTKPGVCDTSRMPGSSRRSWRPGTRQPMSRRMGPTGEA